MVYDVHDCTLQTKVYGNIVVNSEASEKSVLPVLSPISTDFLSSQVNKILYGYLGQKEKNVPISSIENCELVNLKISPEKVLFQPNWAFSGFFELTTMLLHTTSIQLFSERINT